MDVRVAGRAPDVGHFVGDGGKVFEGRDRIAVAHEEGGGPQQEIMSLFTETPAFIGEVAL
jgi:hypothetical protein